MVAVAAAALAGLALAAPAQATLSATISDTRSGLICNGTEVTPGILVVPSGCNNQNFSSITGSVVGSPTFGISANQVSFTTSNLAVTFPDTLMINVVQSGLSFAGDATVSLAVNTLTGSNGSLSGSTATLTAQAPNGAPQVSQKFTTTSLPITTAITLGSVTSDAAIFELTATGPNQTQSTSIAIAAVVAPATPEPGSLVLLGSALAGFGVVGLGRRRRARQRWRGTATAMSRPVPVRPVVVSGKP